MQALLISLFVFFGRTAVSSEKNEVCEALVIHECSGHSLGLLKVLESGDKNISNNECDAFQVSHKRFRASFVFTNRSHFSQTHYTRKWMCTDESTFKVSSLWNGPVWRPPSTNENLQAPFWQSGRFQLSVQIRFSKQLVFSSCSIHHYFTWNLPLFQEYYPYNYMNIRIVFCYYSHNSYILTSSVKRKFQWTWYNLPQKFIIMRLSIIFFFF